MSHPSKDLKVRQNGFGIAAGLEKPYRKEPSGDEEFDREVYGSVSHSGYYGMGLGGRPFKQGQASYDEEIAWYKAQYGEKTSKK